MYYKQFNTLQKAKVVAAQINTEKKRQGSKVRYRVYYIVAKE